MNIYSFSIIAFLLLSFSLFSQKIHKSPITAPIIFTFFGFILGPDLLNLVNLQVSNEITKIIAILTLVLVLFTDASRMQLKSIQKYHNIPVRLLVIGLPLTFLFGWFFAYFFFPQLAFFELALLSAVLCPTDAALIHGVVSFPRVPLRIRQALNIESGLNDGLMVPIVVGLISIVSALETTITPNSWIILLVREIAIGFIVGFFLGNLGGKICEFTHRKKWMDHTFEEISAIAVALLAYTLSELLYGNGFIGAFTSGLFISNYAKSMKKSIQDFASTEGQLLTLLLFFIFGSSFVATAISKISFSIFIYAILSLTVIRMIPVSLSLLGCGLRGPTYLYLGWFGPRGIASIVFAFLVLEKVPTASGQFIFDVAVATILLSIFIHGLTSMLGANWYSRVINRVKGRIVEQKMVKEIPLKTNHHNS